MNKTISFFLASIIMLMLFNPLLGNLTDEKGRVKQEVVFIFKQFEPLLSPREKALLETPSLENLNTIAQSVFLRASGKERKDIAEVQEHLSPYATENLRSFFEKIGDIGSVMPTKKKYDYLLLNGSTVQNMRERLKTLIRLVEIGAIQIDESTQLVLLTGERELFDIETPDVLFNPAPLKQDPHWVQPQTLPSTEAEAALWIFQQAHLPIALRQIKLTHVRAPKNQIKDAQGNILFTRPTTQDTYRTWIEQHSPTPGSCLSISSQPFVYYQDTSMKCILAKLGLKGFTIETVGEDFQERDAFPSRLAIYLDNLARRLYSELELLQLLCQDSMKTAP